MLTATEALKNRISIRQFLPTPLSGALVMDLLEAAREPGLETHHQPWKVIVVAGAEREAVTALARRLFAAGAPSEEGNDPIYPPDLWDPYRSRRYKLGMDLYAQLGIARNDMAGRKAQMERNFDFFGAPIGLFFVIDRASGPEEWIRLGKFMLNLSLLAVDRGLGTCMQEYWATVRVSLHKHLSLAETDMVYCGMALGYPDPDAAANRLRSDRAPVEEFAAFRGF